VICPTADVLDPPEQNARDTPEGTAEGGVSPARPAFLPEQPRVFAPKFANCEEGAHALPLRFRRH
jgi:hypothetical protein